MKITKVLIWGMKVLRYVHIEKVLYSDYPMEQS